MPCRRRRESDRRPRPGAGGCRRGPRRRSWATGQSGFNRLRQADEDHCLHHRAAKAERARKTLQLRHPPERRRARRRRPDLPNSSAASISEGNVLRRGGEGVEELRQVALRVGRLRGQQDHHQRSHAREALFFRPRLPVERSEQKRADLRIVLPCQQRMVGGAPHRRRTNRPARPAR